MLIGRSWSKATSCESKTVSCAPHPPTFSHLTIDKSRRQVHTAVDHARYEVTAQPGLYTSTHRTTVAPLYTSPALLRMKRPSSTGLPGLLCRPMCVFRQITVAFPWERGCLFASGLCRPVRTGFNRRTNPPWSSSRSSIFTARSSVLLCVRAISLKTSTRTGIPRTRRGVSITQYHTRIAQLQTSQ